MKKIYNYFRLQLYISIFLIVVMCVGCSIDEGKKSLDTMKKTGSMELQYATQFTVDYYEGGYNLVTIADGQKYLLIPENMEKPEKLSEDIVTIQLPIEHAYLAASSAMDMFREIDALDIIEMTGTKHEDWSIPKISKMVESGEIEYAGKYSAPDYEIIMKNNCDIAIESTMIYHTSEVKEQLENIGIPVFVDRSSYEADPLGRVEWIKLYGLLSGKYEAAFRYMEKCNEKYEEILESVKNDKNNNQQKQEKTVAFFYISSNGYAVIRKPGDYISKMIDIAGGQYVFSDVVDEEENALSTMNIQMEMFYEKAVDADVLIYNSTIDGEIYSIEQLVEKNTIFKDFKAVKEGNVWCTGKNMYQEITGTAAMIEDFYKVFHEDEKNNTIYIHKL